MKLFYFSYKNPVENARFASGYAVEGYAGRDYTTYVEYDGTEIEADNEIAAWKIFLGMSGAFGCPAAEDYDVILK